MAAAAALVPCAVHALKTATIAKVGTMHLISGAFIL
jgi:hypothetical protein